MHFLETILPGAMIVDVDRREDARGFFGRTWCVEEFAERSLVAQLVQCSISFNAIAGTLRGMHYQIAPHEEAKLVRCTMGAIHDVLLDLRPQSPTYKQWVAVELTADNRRALYVPQGVAHGFETLTDRSEVLYQISAPYHPESARGVRWNDPAFGIQWPMPPRAIAPRDEQYEDFTG